MNQEERLRRSVEKVKLLCRLYNVLEPLGLSLDYEGYPSRLGHEVQMSNGNVVCLDNGVIADLEDEVSIFRSIFGSIPFHQVDSVVIALDATESNFIFGWY